VLVGATIVLANLLPSPQAVPPPEEHAKRVTYDLRPTPEVAKIEPPPAPVAESPTPAPAQATIEPPPQASPPVVEAPAKPAVVPKPRPKPAVSKSVTPSPKKKPAPTQPAQTAPVQTAEAAPADASPSESAPPSSEPAPPASEPTPPAAESAPAAKESWYLQIGVYSVEANAAKSVARLRKAGLQPHQGAISVKAGKVFRVRCGPFASQEEADRSKAKAVAIGFKDARIARD